MLTLGYISNAIYFYLPSPAIKAMLFNYIYHLSKIYQVHTFILVYSYTEDYILSLLRDIHNKYIPKLGIICPIGEYF